METKVVCVKGPAGMYARADEPNTGIWGGNQEGYRGVIWDGTDRNDARYHFEMTKPDNKFMLLHVESRCYLGIDATQYSGDIGRQFYLKPEAMTSPGGYESPVIYDGNLSGVLSGQVEYDDPDRGKYVSCAFTVDVLT
jgi:hypothetical protein